ncbi:hypothetical protein C8R44DRAFT_917957 [Mycena epipterygia]|nr:hypothetical protein C8R44DRAFT_917957 [Mycena epipterygia]
MAMNSLPEDDEQPGDKAAQGAKSGSVAIKLRPKSLDHPGPALTIWRPELRWWDASPDLTSAELGPTGTRHEHDPPLRNASYSILALPTETTAEIFARCLPDVASTPGIDMTPLLLGGICSNWRSISLDTPELWSSLKIAVSDAPVDSIETWLTRARRCPLSLLVDCFISDGRFIGVLQRHSHTWRDVELGLPFEQFYKFEPDLRLPMLERFAITTFLGRFGQPLDLWCPRVSGQRYNGQIKTTFQADLRALANLQERYSLWRRKNASQRAFNDPFALKRLGVLKLAVSHSCVCAMRPSHEPVILIDGNTGSWKVAYRIGEQGAFAHIKNRLEARRSLGSGKCGRWELNGKHVLNKFNWKVIFKPPDRVISRALQSSVPFSPARSRPELRAQSAISSPTLPFLIEFSTAVHELGDSQAGDTAP